MIIFFFISCTSVIDKKMNKESFVSDMKEIQKKHLSEYSAKDFDEFSKNAFSMYFFGTKEDNRTYRQILDEIKNTRLKAENEYNNNLIAAENAVSVRFIDKGSLKNEDIDIKYNLFKLSITNKSSNDIIELQCKIRVCTPSGEFLLENITDDLKTLKSGQSIESVYEFLVNEINEQKVFDTDMSNLKINVIPCLIVFSNNKKIVVPANPNEKTDFDL